MRGCARRRFHRKVSLRQRQTGRRQQGIETGVLSNRIDRSAIARSPRGNMIDLIHR